MVWRIDDPQGNEAAKCRFDVLPYLHSGLDLGCGPDKVWPHLIGIDSQKDTNLFGIKMKPDMVLPDVSRLRMFADGSMQCVFSSHTLEHIPDHLAALAEWWRVIEPCGYLVLYLPHADLYPRIGQPGANPDHVHDFLPGDIIAAMEAVAPDWSLVVNDSRAADREYSFLQVYRKEAADHGQRHPWTQLLPGKRAAIVRVGGHGDALWASSPAWHLKQAGYHVTVYTAHTGAAMLAHDPNIDRVIALPNNAMTDEDLRAYWCHEAVKYERFHNLIGSVEKTLLFHDSDDGYWHPSKLRHQLANRNYLDQVHLYCDVPMDPKQQRFYPTERETQWAAQMRDKLPGPLVLIAPAGSGVVKYWPHSQRLMDLLAERGVYSVVIGDVRDPGVTGVEPWGSVVGMEWPVRHACAFALCVDAVVATESLIANAVAFEPMLKLITLSHSSNENLTRDWTNCAAIEPQGVACHPCHRIHGNFQFCAQDSATGAAACQATVTADTVAAFLFERLGIEARETANA